MLTIFSTPKPFRGHTAVIQRNAIRSWTLLHPDCEVILFGKDEGTAETAAELEMRHVPDVGCSEFGTPLVNALFEKANRLAENPILCYINADIILMNDFIQAVQRLIAVKRRFLMVGRRWNLDVTNAVNFSRPDWESALRSEVFDRGELCSHWFIDYFVFRTPIFGEIPPFAIGRPYFDNWLLWRARSLRVPVIDATEVVTCVHQTHESRYSLLGSDSPGQSGDANVQTEVSRNHDLAGGSFFTIADATHRLTPAGLSWIFDRDHLLRRLDTLPKLYPYLSFPLRAIRKSAHLLLDSRSKSSATH